MRWKRKREQALERELQSHLDLEAEEQREIHATPDDARYAARRALGNTTLIREATRETWGFAWLDRLSQDARYGLRTLKNNAGVSAIAILTAALAIGANTSIFSVVNAVLLRPLPYPDAGRLVAVTNISAKENFMGLGVGDFQYGAWRDQAKVFDGIAAFTSRQFTITGSGDPEQLKVRVVTPGFLRTMGVQPLEGRDFAPGDDAPRGGRVALMSYGLWMSRFGGDRSVLSKQITLEGKPYSVAGILPRDLEFPDNSDASLLIAMTEPVGQPKGAVYFYNVVARLKQGITAERAQADLGVINKRLESAFPQRFGRAPRSMTQVTDLHAKLVGNVRPALLILLGAAGLVLLIACVNIGNLLLARAISRQREIAVRMALGAGRRRVFVQLMTEGMLLAAVGGAAGLALAFGGVRLLKAIAPVGVPHIDSAHISGAVLAFNIAIALCSGLLFCIAPIRGAVGIDPEALKQTAHSMTGSRRHRRLENALVTAEVAFALMLLAGSGLLIRTLAGLVSIAPGFHPENVLTVRVSLPYWKYPTAARQRAFLDGWVERTRTGPGVEAAGLTACLPYGGFVMTSSVRVEGRTPDAGPDANASNASVNFAGGDYLSAMGIPLLEGRAITDADGAGKPGVGVVNQSFARKYFPDGGALGHRVKLQGVTDWMEIVGVTGDLKQGGLASETREEVFQPPAQSESGSSAQTVAIRSKADLKVLIPWLRAQLAELDRDLPPPEIETMQEKMAALVASQVFVMRLLVLFAGIAVVLAAIGIYGVLVYSVEQRTHEIGIRLALGARRVQIMGLIVGRGLRLSIAGAALGTLGGLAVTRYLKSLLYGVTPHDPVTLLCGCALVILVALGAAYIPARRAIGLDPMATLRVD